MTYRSDFASRHIGPNQYQIQTMLLELGYKDLDTFISIKFLEGAQLALEARGEEDSALRFECFKDYLRLDYKSGSSLTFSRTAIGM